MDGRGYCEVSCPSSRTRTNSIRTKLLVKRIALGLFLFAQQTAQRIHSVRGILPRFADITERTACATELRFQHVRRDAANVRDKFRIGRGALNHERNCGSTFAAAFGAESPPKCPAPGPRGPHRADSPAGEGCSH